MGLDANFLNPFLEGTMLTLKVQCKIEVTPGKAFLKDNPLAMDIAGYMDIHCQKFNGTIAICLPSAFYLSAMSNMIDEKYETLTPDLYDGAGEMLNIIFGHAKRVLNDKGYDLPRAFPKILTGSDLSKLQNKAIVGIVQPFKSSVGEFYVVISPKSLEGAL